MQRIGYCFIMHDRYFPFLTDKNNYGVILTASIIAGIALLLVVTVILIYMRMFRNKSVYVLVTSIEYTRSCLFEL